MARKKTEIVIPPGCLWPNTPSGAPLNIEVFGATGEYRSGKTLLGLSIAPGVHPEGHPFAGAPRTLLLDFEKSAGTYGGTGCKRIDVPLKMLEIHQGKYGPYEVFKWFSEVVDRIAPNQFDVIHADPITDIESGLVEWVRKNPQQFNLTANQIQKAGGLLWGAVKDFWKQVLLKLSTRCQCFFFTSHLRDVWMGTTHTNRREPKGKDTLMELASLYLWLERKADQDGNVPGVPSAMVVKERLADTIVNEDGSLDIIQLLPPRLPVGTVQAIRGYIANPPNYNKLRDGERVVVEQVTAEEMERLRLARAEAERDTETMRMSRQDRAAYLQGKQQETAAAQPQNSDQTAAVQQTKQDKAKAAAEQAEMDRLKAEAAKGLEAADKETARLLAGQPAEAVPAMGGVQADGQLDPNQGSGQPRERPAEQPANDKATKAQVNEILSLAKQLNIDDERLKTICGKAGAASVHDLQRSHALLLIEKLTMKIGTAGNGAAAKN